MASEHLGRRLQRLRRLADLTQEELAERSGVSVDVVRQLEQQRKHSARLPTLHALANGLGVELTTLLGDPPGVTSSGENDGPRFVAVRRAIMPALWETPQAPGSPDFSLPRLRDRIAEAWTQYHAAEFDTVMKALPDLIGDARAATASGGAEERAAGFAALGKALQLGGHVAVRMGKTDLALASLERAFDAAAQSSGQPGPRTSSANCAARWSGTTSATTTPSSWNCPAPPREPSGPAGPEAAPPVGVVVLPDCPVASPSPPSEPCCEFADHQGAHSWQLRAEDKQT